MSGRNHHFLCGSCSFLNLISIRIRYRNAPDVVVKLFFGSDVAPNICSVAQIYPYCQLTEQMDK